MNWHNAFHMHRESCPKELCWENCPTIHVGGTHELFRRFAQQIHLGGLSNVFISEGCPQLKQIFLFGK